MNRERVIFWVKILNALDLIAIALVLLIAFAMQLLMSELPCPLCLLQRIGLIAIGFGFLLNVRYHIRTSHYALSLLAAVFTAFASMRQILLHIAPGDGGYGSPIFGLHMYTWVFIMAMLAIIYIATVMSWPAQHVLSKTHSEERDELRTPWARNLCHIAFAVFFIATLANTFSTFKECGLKECPDNPTTYVHSI